MLNPVLSDRDTTPPEVPLFTGLVEDVGVIERAERRSDAMQLSIVTQRVDSSELAVGDSIAIDGVCLTATECGPRGFTALAGAETLRLTTLGQRRVRDRVNLERALRVSDRLGGHIVQGHVDGTATLSSRRDMGSNLELEFRPPAELLRYIVAKGSIALDGISLTVNRVSGTSFAVALIPHTVEATTLRDRTVGSSVNVEVDLVAKYVERLVEGYRP